MRGFFTNPSRADDSFIPFKRGANVHFCGYSPSYSDNASAYLNTAIIQEDVFTNDNANRKIICNKKGIYSLFVSFYNLGAARAARMQFIKNGTVIDTIEVPTGSGSVVYSNTIDLEIDDYIMIFKNGTDGNGTVAVLLLYEE